MKRALVVVLVVFSVLGLVAAPASAQESVLELARKGKTSFLVGEERAFLYPAPEAAEGRPWVWYAPTLKGISLSQREFYFEAWVKAGIGVAGFDLGEVRGSPASSEKFSKFYDEMVKRGYSKKPILLGQSRGGLMMLAWAVRNPEKVQAVVGIYPVFNLESWPLKNSKAAVLADYGMTEEEIRGKLRELNPIENLDGLLKEKVPIFVVHGDSDVVVPYAENTGLLKERYEAGGGAMTVKLIPGEGHKVSPSFFECVELREFVVKQGK